MEKLLHRFRNREPVFVLSHTCTSKRYRNRLREACKPHLQFTIAKYVAIRNQYLGTISLALMPKKCVTTTAKVVLVFSPELRAECYAKD